MAKPAKTIPEATEGAAKPKSKKMLFIGIGVAVLLVAGGAGWYFTMGPGGGSHAEAPKAKAKAKQELAPRFVKLETFTVNLNHEAGEDERVLQTVINLEVHSVELEEQVKLYMPKIYNNVLILLSRKHPADISTPDGKQQLAGEVKAEVEYVLGLRSTPPPIPVPIAHDAASGAAPHAAPVPAEHASRGGESDDGVAAVLFTTFIIQ